MQSFPSYDNINIPNSTFGQIYQVTQATVYSTKQFIKFGNNVMYRLLYKRNSSYPYAKELHLQYSPNIQYNTAYSVNAIIQATSFVACGPKFSMQFSKIF